MRVFLGIVHYSLLLPNLHATLHRHPSAGDGKAWVAQGVVDDVASAVPWRMCGLEAPESDWLDDTTMITEVSSVGRGVKNARAHVKATYLNESWVSELTSIPRMFSSHVDYDPQWH